MTAEINNLAESDVQAEREFHQFNVSHLRLSEKHSSSIDHCLALITLIALFNVNRWLVLSKIPNSFINSLNICIMRGCCVAQ